MTLADLQVGDFVLVNEELVGVVVATAPLFARVHTDELVELEAAEVVEHLTGSHGEILKSRRPVLRLVG